MVKQAARNVASELWLRDVIAGDLPIFFSQQQEAEARHMAAFTGPDSADRAAFMDRWELLTSETVRVKTIKDSQKVNNCP